MKKNAFIFMLNYILVSSVAFAQTPEFRFNGIADVIFSYPPKGSGGRAFVHNDGNVLTINYAGDFTGGTSIGRNVYFNDGGNSFISSGNFGIGTETPEGTLELRKLNSGLIFDLNTNGITKIISKGWNASVDFNTFQINGVQNVSQLHLNTNGNVGIGNANPELPLTVYGNTRIYPARIGSGDARSFTVSHAFSKWPFISNEYPVFLTTGGGNQPLILDAARIGIGTANPSYKLDVCGTIRANEVKVLPTAGCDFVFDKEYKLIKLNELEKFVKTKQHLPEIASEKEMIENGLGIKAFQMQLLQKVEELTLYLIAENKANVSNQKIIKEQTKRLNEQEIKINQLIKASNFKNQKGYNK